MLEVKLLGAFDLRRDGQSLAIRWRRQANRVLALLTLNHNRALSTSWITEALRLADGILPHSLSELYTLLGEDRSRIRHGHNSVYFDLREVTVDVILFERLVEKGMPSDLAAALKLYQGGLLKDWDEEGWFAEERESYQASYVQAIDTLARHALQRDDFDLAASYLRSYVSVYPQMDSAWARLIEVYDRAGNTSLIEDTAARYLASCEERARAEGREFQPSPRVLAVCARARNPETALRTSPPEVSAVVSAAVPPVGGKSVPAHPPTPAPDVSPTVLEPVGGAVSLDSPYYLARPTDKQVFAAVAQKESFVLVKGPRQVGKSSLLVRVLHRARQSGAQVVRTDWQKISRSTVETLRPFLLELADAFVDQLDLEAQPANHFEPHRSDIGSFERFLKRDVFPAVATQLVWIIDEADRIFECDFRDDVFAMLRSWHGERANDASGRWQKLTVVIAYATEAYLFISNLNQSPFNIGARFDLDDFTPEQVRELNRLYHSPLQSEADVDALVSLVGGHPYLVRRCLQEMLLRQRSFAQIEAGADAGYGLFTDHLSRIRLALQRDTDMLDALRALLHQGALPDFPLFLRLRAAGLVAGDTPETVRLRCRLYETYLRKGLS